MGLNTWKWWLTGAEYAQTDLEVKSNNLCAFQCDWQMFEVKCRCCCVVA